MTTDKRTVLSPMQRFWHLLKPEKKDITNIYVYSIFSGLVNLSLPLGIQAIINLIQGGQVSTSWIVLVVVVVLGIAISGLLQIFQLRIAENIQQKIMARSAFEFAYRIPRIKMEAMFRHHAPELMNRFFDTISVQKGLSKILIDFSAAALEITFGLLLLSFYHPFFIVFGLLLLVVVYAIFRFTAKRGMDASLKESTIKYRLAHWLEELARTQITFKFAGVSDLPLKKTDEQVSDYLSAREKHFTVLVQQYSLMVLFQILVVAGLLAIGGILVMEQQMNIGQFVAAEIIILMVMSAVKKLILSLETIYDVLTSLEKIGLVTDMEIETKEGVDLKEHIEGENVAIRMDKVSFKYPGAKNNTLQNLSLHIQEGERVLITGSSGVGKSTLMRILGGLYQIDDGILSYNDLFIGNIQPDALRNLIGVSLSEEILFEGSISDNITMGRENIGLEDVKWATEKVLLKDYINNLPKGLDTVISPEGKSLPRNITQKLMLARAIVNRPKLLLLEDAFVSILDRESKSIIDFILDKKNKWTVVAISSDQYLAQKCDKIAIMEDGHIINSGNFHEMQDCVQLNSKSNA